MKHAPRISAVQSRVKGIPLIPRQVCIDGYLTDMRSLTQSLVLALKLTQQLPMSGNRYSDLSVITGQLHTATDCVQRLLAAEET